MNAHEQLVKHTALFIQRYSEIILSHLDKGTMNYSYTKNSSALIVFTSSSHDTYTFELFSKVFSYDDKFNSTSTHYPMKLTVEGPNQNENTIYQSIKKIMPFISVDYKKSFEIFDFVQSDDHLLGTIQSFKRFNSMTNDFQAVFNGVKIIHDIKYSAFYKKIYNRAKLNNETLTSLFFDDELNISTLYSVILDFSPHYFVEIDFASNTNDYYLPAEKKFLSKDELFEYITSSRRFFIKNKIGKLFKNIEIDIEFDNNFKDQIKILEMLTI